jgi:hypothetical protein
MLDLLRPGLLDGATVAFAGTATAPAREACATLGAATPMLAAGLLEEEAAAGAAAAALEPAPTALVCSANDLAEIDVAWVATRAVANACWIEREDRAGKLVLLAPRDDAATRAALENLARSLSVEWARYGIVTSAVLPGPRTPDAEVAQLVAYLVSEAGDYFSGCAFTLA